MKIILSDSVIEVATPQQNVVFEQIVDLVIFVIELKRLQNLVDILVSAMHLRLGSRKMSVNYGQFGLTHFDRAPNGTLVAAYTQNSCADLGKLVIFEHFGCVFFVENNLEKSHLNVASQFLDQLGVLNVFYLLLEPFIQFLDDIVLPLLRLDTGRNHTLG